MDGAGVDLVLSTFRTGWSILPAGGKKGLPAKRREKCRIRSIQQKQHSKTDDSHTFAE